MIRIERILCVLGWLIVFEMHALAADIAWTGGSGQWQDVSHWSSGSLPGQNDNVTIDVANAVTVTSNAASIIKSLNSRETLQLTGGALEVRGASSITGPLNIENSSLGAVGAELVASGPTTVLNGGFYANNNAQLRLPSLVSVAASAVSQAIDWTATGTGSVLDLSKLNSIEMTGDARFGRFHVVADGGGKIDLSELDSVISSNRPTRFYSRGAGSLVDISTLSDLSQVWELRAEGGEIRWANPSSIVNVSLHVSSTGILDASNVATGRNNWLEASSGGTLSMPALQTVAMDANQQTVDWQANGANSVLNLSKLDTITMEGDARFGRFHVVATGGGKIDLSELDSVTSFNRPTRFYSRGAGSVVDIGKLSDLSQVWELRAEGGEIRWANPSSIVNVSLHVSSGGILDASNVATGRNNGLDASTGGTLSLPALRTFAMDANQQTVDWQANGVGSVLDLSKLDSVEMTGDARFGRFHIVATGGGNIDLSELDSVTSFNRPTRFYSRGAGSVVDISSLSDLSQVWELRAEGGEIRWANSSSILNVSLHVSSGGILDASNVATGRNNALDASAGGTLSMPALRTFAMDANQQTVDWQANGTDSVLDLSKLDSITMEGDARFGRFHVVATGGGKIDLSELDSVISSNRPTRFYSRGAGSVVDISSLSDLSQVWELRAEGGEIRWANSSSIVNVGVHVSSAGIIDASNVTSGRNNGLDASAGGMLSMPALRTFAMDANQQNVDWQANGTGSVLDLSKLDSITIEGDARFGRFHVVAIGGGKIDLGELDTVSYPGTRPVNLISRDSGSEIDISSLTQLSNARIQLESGTVKSAAQLSLMEGATLGGQGRLEGGIELAGGMIDPSNGPIRFDLGLLTIEGNLTITRGSYVPQVFGLNELADRLIVNGTATLGGTLDLRASFAARIGDQISLLQATSVNGQFSELKGIPIANSQLGFAIGYTATEVFARATLIGDVNFDNAFDSGDLVQIFQAGEYEDAIENNSIWIDGDWNGDSDFSSGDLVVAFQTGAYEAGVITALSVPEPAGLVQMMPILLWLFQAVVCDRRNKR